MSSTGRGGQRSPADNYPTPREAVAALLHTLHLPGGNWCEPCAGDGAIVSEVERWRSDVNWWLNEPRFECEERLLALNAGEVTSIDARALGPILPGNLSVIITNPPFSLTMEIVRSLWGRSTHLVILEKITFLGEHQGQQRSRFLRDNPPDVYYIPERLSFTGDGRTDSIPYAWYHWRPGEIRMEGDEMHGRGLLVPLSVQRFRSHSLELCLGGDA